MSSGRSCWSETGMVALDESVLRFASSQDVLAHREGAGYLMQG
jgi:hypothetical protein